jgi:exopolyphosphatase/guanosine-5'-triphosphate,3'-diphosphate pyrophosphatase
MNHVGVIDIGTNTILCLKAIIGGNHFEIIFDKRYHYRVGRGLDDAGKISPECKQNLRRAFGEALKSLTDCDQIKIVATEVFRRSKDGGAFAGALTAEVGQHIEIIESRREAELSFLGATQGSEYDSGKVAVIDVGGGSTELAIGENGKLTGWAGAKIGAVAIAETVGFEQKPSRYIEYAINIFGQSNFLELSGSNIDKVVAVGGTVVTLAGVSVGLKEYRPEKIQGYQITAESLRRILDELAGLNLERRKKRMAFDPDRADIIIGGGAIISAFMEYWGIRIMTVSVFGLRYGLLREMIAQINA